MGHYALDCPTYDRGRSGPEGKSSRQPTRLSTERTERLNDKVLLSRKHIPALKSCPKLEPRCRGPCGVIERIETIAYRLALPVTYECHNVSHVSQLVPHCPHLPDLVSQGADAGWLPIRNAAGIPTKDYEENFIVDQRGPGADAPGPRQVARNP